MTHVLSGNIVAIPIPTGRGPGGQEAPRRPGALRQATHLLRDPLGHQSRACGKRSSGHREAPRAECAAGSREECGHTHQFGCPPFIGDALLSASLDTSILPGTLIGSKLCHLTAVDFYLSSHADIRLAFLYLQFVHLMEC
ncbi:uncharacterized protein LOC119289841 [Triticum dicoccoides]|uniref:uncharacterized protein LOC119289841 n=1 Tax=Triticum dicoccoides TaxID=85692 RepID=UPI001890B4EB|nr:uncharacterized protein LOC119289841 [Triticum dicoccoides]